MTIWPVESKSMPRVVPLNVLLALEENRFLKEQERVPSPELVGRKQQLLARLDESLAALRSAPDDQAASAENHEAAEQTKTRILQFLHLDRENEQLLLRHSLSPPQIKCCFPGA
jgi:hypothetical protein